MPVLRALSGPFAAPLFAPVSAIRDSLWMRLQLYFRLIGFQQYRFFVIKLQNRPLVKYFLPYIVDYPSENAIETINSNL